MCIAIPGIITSLNEENTAIVNFEGIERNVKLDLLGDYDNSIIGKYVLVHVGYAISFISEEEGKETIEIFRELMSEENVTGI